VQGEEMREIGKYRGIRRQDDKIVYGYFLINPNGPCIYDPEIGDMPVIPETVGENTGLKDCKRTEEYPEGQEIYGSIPINGKISKGGDKVKASIYQGEEEQVLSVYYEDGAFWIDYKDSESDRVPVGCFVGSIEIICNIHEDKP